MCPTQAMLLAARQQRHDLTQPIGEGPQLRGALPGVRGLRLLHLAALAFGLGLLPAFVAVAGSADLAVQPPGRLLVVVIDPLLEPGAPGIDPRQVGFQLGVVAGQDPPQP